MDSDGFLYFFIPYRVSSYIKGFFIFMLKDNAAYKAGHLQDLASPMFPFCFDQLDAFKYRIFLKNFDVSKTSTFNLGFVFFILREQFRVFRQRIFCCIVPMVQMGMRNNYGVYSTNYFINGYG